MPFIRAHGKQKRARGRWAAKGLLERHSVAPFVTRATNGAWVDSCRGRVPTLRFVSFEAAFQSVPFAAEKELIFSLRAVMSLRGCCAGTIGLQRLRQVTPGGVTPNQVVNARVDAIGTVYRSVTEALLPSKCAATKRNRSARTALTERHCVFAQDLFGTGPVTAENLALVEGPP